MGEQVRISFLGDVTCDRPMLKAACKNGVYDFAASLSAIRMLVSESDCVVANLETVFAGEKFGYNPHPITYNTPDALCDGVKAAGITLLTTANNHCLDMDSHGIDRTIEVLDAMGLEHTGTLHSQRMDAPRYLIKEIKGIRVAIVSLTDALNARADGSSHSEAAWSQVNNLHPRRVAVSGNPVKALMKKILPVNALKNLRAMIMRARGIPLVSQYTDNRDIPEQDRGQIAWAIDLLESARRESDIVIACIHSGGQFNAMPGTFSMQLYDMLAPHADVMIGNHPHVVQPMTYQAGKVRAYSLGSVNMSASADYVAKNTDFDFSVLLHIDLEKSADGTVKVCSPAFSLLQAREDENRYVTVSPFDEHGQSKEKIQQANDVLRRFAAGSVEEMHNEVQIEWRSKSC